MDNLDCPVCLDQARDAMECTQCAQIFCEPCTHDLKKCPTCRAVSSFKESAFARKLINNMPKQCEFCGFKTTAAELKYHLPKCELRDFSCNLCTFKAKKQNFVSHIVNSHSSNLLDTFTYNPGSVNIEVPVWENKTRILKHSTELLTTQTGLKSYTEVSCKIKITNTKNPAFIVLGFSSKPIHVAKGFLGGDLGTGNWGLAGNGALGEEGKWKKGDTFKSGDIVTLEFSSKIIRYYINGRENGYSFKFSGDKVYIACSLFYAGDTIEILS